MNMTDGQLKYAKDLYSGKLGVFDPHLGSLTVRELIVYSNAFEISLGNKYFNFNSIAHVGKAYKSHNATVDIIRRLKNGKL